MSDRKIKIFDDIEYLNKPIDGYRWTGPIMDRPQYGSDADKFAIELRPKNANHFAIYTRDEHKKAGDEQECMGELGMELNALSKLVKNSNHNTSKNLTNAFLKVCKAYDHVVYTLPIYDGYITDGFEIKEEK